MIYLIIITVILLILLSLTYKRYYPIRDVNSVSIDHVCDKIKVIDIRDYNISYNDPIEGSINIPIAYLKRFIHEIPNNDLYLVVSNLLEKNVGVRLLRQFGFNVIGYTVVDSDENNKDIESLYCKGG
ncbi:hypothetical protein [Heyndrickxia camelliae]|uniref:Rhodanese domain-containing protein n=1 Tax=Heyndrickxia camelliae TaxID=1707093 RepID=A0A2N3LMC2_9BACI|nr:hypothetical protein [Heyndrickxia camelliae]PKR85781.1 hypothetical protein CWO92_05220 [Heyndrickxia camelliae]